MKTIQAPDATKDATSFEDLPLIAAICSLQIELQEGRAILSSGKPSQKKTLRRDSPTIEWFSFLEQNINRLAENFYPTNLAAPIKTFWSGLEIYCMTHRILKQGQPHKLPSHIMGPARAGQLYVESGLNASCWSPCSEQCTGYKGECQVDHKIPRNPRKELAEALKKSHGFNVNKKENLQLLCQTCNAYKTNKTGIFAKECS